MPTACVYGIVRILNWLIYRLRLAVILFYVSWSVSKRLCREKSGVSVVSSCEEESDESDECVGVRTEKVTIIGSGRTAITWAMLFVSAGYQVTIFDIFSENITHAIDSIRVQLKILEKRGVLRGHLNADEQINCITGCTDLKAAVKDAIFIQECEREHYLIKILIFKVLDRVIDDKVILSSSTGVIPLTIFTDKIKHKSQVLVSHLVEPFYYGTIVELVPTIWSDYNNVVDTNDIMLNIGQEPICLSWEIWGYVVNRIHYIVLNEIWRLIEEGIVDVQDVDKILSEGLGPHYSFVGPLESAHLRPKGIYCYIKRYKKDILKVCNRSKETPCMNTSRHSESIYAHLNAVVPSKNLRLRRSWHDYCFARLSIIKNSMDSQYSH